ncbi:hypothetical protein TKV_c16500 [Thermoanaerobacter kivui]|uniref:DUF2149 domain-containing protein n=1 Tax=Thermoanaerobacter kivui TaxID=2325 RepID=A0A097ASL7_THEKI|nr:DUF2149 domain-containing protein [Thermoanaerobacter kivui]AIS51714.1 hypothetical protein TKV_c05150 [Thermoanaerobacter kivui]AIS52804.1 hypothetical protein TKV_c16500 [Thermoanaerobacter kivui]
MKRKTSNLSRLEAESEEFNPMTYVVNLADLMLVFACGLIISLMLNGNPGKIVGKIVQIKEITNQSENIKGQAIEGKGDLEKLGEAYKDNKTGKIYIITK